MAVHKFLKSMTNKFGIVQHNECCALLGQKIFSWITVKLRPKSNKDHFGLKKNIQNFANVEYI